MRRYNCFLCYIFFIFCIGCTQGNTNIPEKTLQVSTGTSVIETPKDEDNSTITNISEWSHPTKKIFFDSGIVINKIVLKNSRTYPEFYVSLPDSNNLKDILTFENLLKKIAVENGFWDYKLIDEDLLLEVDVSCDKSSKNITDIKYISKDNYFSLKNDLIKINGIDRVKVSLSDVNTIIKSTFSVLPKNNYVIYDHMDDVDGTLYYVLHGFESVIDNEETGVGHSATWGWYYLDAVDGVVYEWDLNGKAVEVTKSTSPKTIKIHNDKDFKEWQMIYCKLGGDGSSLWQVNNTLGILQKIDLVNLKLVKEIDVKKTFIHGRIVALGEVPAANSIPSQLYVAVENEGNYAIYKSLYDDTFKWFRNKDDAGKTFDKIHSVNFWIDKEQNPPRIKAHINYGEYKLDSINDTSLTWTDLSASAKK